MNKRALITGITGMDGSHLADFLLNKGYKVYGMVRRSSSISITNIEHIIDKIDILHGDMTDQNSLLRCLKDSNPDEVYNLAAQSFVKSSFETPISTSDVTGLGALRILEVIRITNKKIKFYQASSSEMIGNTFSKIQNEKAILNPRSPYAIAKVFAHNITKNYRDSYNMFACSGILFNHESPLRGEEFVTRKISKGLCEIKLNKKKLLELGNLDSKRDWGFAGDYVEGMWKMLQHKKPDDYVLATNKAYSVRDFINLSCDILKIKIKWIGKGKKEKAIDLSTKKIIIKINSKYYRPSEVHFLKGDYNKAKKTLRWRPKVLFKDLVKMMIEEDLKRLRKEK